MSAGAFNRSGLTHDHDIECSDCEKVIPAGETVMWDEPSYEYGETDPYCVACTDRQKAEFEAIDWEAFAREQFGGDA